jgi:hypothetical protein
MKTCEPAQRDSFQTREPRPRFGADSPSPDTSTQPEPVPAQEKTKRQFWLDILEQERKKLPRELWQDLPVEDLDDRQLEQEVKATTGLYGLRQAKTWKQVRDALAMYLDMTGPNVSHASCGPISLTHAMRLGTGLPMSAMRHKECKIGYKDKKIILETPAYLKASPQEQLAMAGAQHEKLLKAYDINQDGIQFTPDIRVIEKKLLQAGNGAQALIFNTKIFDNGDNVGHVTLAVNIRGQIFHIDNNAIASAVVTPLRTQLFWYQARFLEQFPHWNPNLPLPSNVGKFSYGILNTRIMDYVTSGEPLETPPIPQAVLPPRPPAQRKAAQRPSIFQTLRMLATSFWNNFSSSK